MTSPIRFGLTVHTPWWGRGITENGGRHLIAPDPPGGPS
jgi:hypothetical protein